MSTEEMLDYIQKYNIESSVSLPRNISIPGFNLNLLYKRLNEAKKAFLLLNDTKMYVDAALIAGHVLEVCATIYYIKFANDKELNARKYVAKSSVNTIFSILDIDQSDLKDDMYKGIFDECVDYLAETGHLILKCPPKNTDKHKYNQNLISNLRSMDRTNQEKRKIVKENYEMPIVNDYLNCFLSGIKQKLRENTTEKAESLIQAIKVFYFSYCGFKHAGPLIYPGEIKETEIKLSELSPDTYIPAVFLSLDMIANDPIYIK